MPNPLILTTAAPKADAKPETPQRNAQESEGGSSFEDVLKDETLEKPFEIDAAEVLVADAETDSVDDESETPEPIVATLENGLPEERSPSAELVAPTLDTPRKAAVPDRHPQGEKVAVQTLVSGKGVTPLPDGRPFASAVIPTPLETSQSAVARTSPQAPTSQIAEQAIIMRASVAAPEKAPEQPVNPAKTRAEPAPMATATEKATPVKPETEVKRAPLMVNQPQQPGQTWVDQSDPATSLLSESEGIASVKSDSALNTAREVVPPQTPGSARAETARAIAGQMAAVITAKPGAGGVEIALSPEELGRVSITLNGREDGLHLTIAAERPETLDLMRRHISVLTAEFQKLGYGDLSFDLGTSADTPQKHDGDNARASFEADDPQPDPETITKPTPTGLTQGLDMRL